MIDLPTIGSASDTIRCKENDLGNVIFELSSEHN